MTAPIIIPIEVRNPGAYLAACGVVEIVGAFDAGSRSRWERRPVLFHEKTLSAIACVVQTSISEQELGVAIRDALSGCERWEAFTLDGRRVPLDAVGKDESLTAIRVSIQLCERRDFFVIDHWYQKLARADDPALKKRLQEGKSDWKFWGGQVRLHEVLLGLIDSLPSAGDQSSGTIADLLSLQRMTGSSLNLDAAARRGALDRGFGTNEAKKATRDVTGARPALELLGAIGLSAFFPPRRIGGPDRTARSATVGYDGSVLSYCAWAIEAPLPLARLLARGVAVPGMASLEQLAARRVEAGSKYYHRFEYARGVGAAQLMSAPTEPEEDDDVGSDAGTG